jgi:hypothetical protein
MASPDSRRVLAGALAAALVAAGVPAAADTYKILDEKGRVQYTDRVPPDAINRGMVELNKQGMAKKVTEPAPTPEQRRILEEKAEREKLAKKEAERQRAVDNALLQSYTSEADIDVAKRRNLALVGAAIISAEARIKALERRAAALEKERVFYESKPLPDKLKRDIASVAAEIPKQYELIQAKNEEALAINQKYSEQKERYREVKSRLAANQGTPAKVQ